MLLLDDDDELPALPGEGETDFRAQLGPTGPKMIDSAIVGHVRSRWLKVARVIHDAIDAGAFPMDDAVVDLHARRVIELVAAGTLEAQGNLRKPRLSEIRLPLAPRTI